MTKPIAHRVEYLTHSGARYVERVFNQGDRDSAAACVLKNFPTGKILNVEAIDFDAPRVWGELDFNEYVPAQPVVSIGTVSPAFALAVMATFFRNKALAERATDAVYNAAFDAQRAARRDLPFVQWSQLIDLEDLLDGLRYLGRELVDQRQAA